MVLLYVTELCNDNYELSTIKMVIIVTSRNLKSFLTAKYIHALENSQYNKEQKTTNIQSKKTRQKKTMRQLIMNLKDCNLSFFW